MRRCNVCLEWLRDSKNYFGFVVDEFCKLVHTIELSWWSLSDCRPRSQINKLNAVKIGIMCFLCTPRPIYRLTYRPILDRCTDRHIGQVSVDMSADISVECRSICRPTLDRYVGRYVHREWLSDCRPTCRSICYWHSADTSLLLALRNRGTCLNHLFCFCSL